MSTTLEWALIAFISLSILYFVWRGGTRNPETTGEIGRQVGGLSNRLGALTTRVGHVEEKLEELERDAATTKDIARVEERIETVRAQMEGQYQLSQRTNHSVERIERFLIERGLGAGGGRRS